MPNCKRCGSSYYLGSPEGYCADCEDTLKREPAEASKTSIVLTTSFEVPNRKIEKVIRIVAYEAAIGMNIFRDIANNWRDVFGGTSNSSQNALREVREACLDWLRREAATAGADAVISIDLDYNQLATGGTGGILFVAATGTAVKLAG